MQQSQLKRYVPVEVFKQRTTSINEAGHTQQYQGLLAAKHCLQI